MKNANSSYKNASPRTKLKIRTVVRAIHKDFPEKSAKEVLGLMQKDKNLSTLPKPTVRAVQDMLQKWDNPKAPEDRDNRNRLDQLEQVWHLHLTPNMPAEAVARVLELQTHTGGVEMELKDGSVIGPMRLTVRQAEWAARLYRVKSLKNTGTLWLAVVTYSMAELLAELGGPAFTTEFLDRIVANPNAKQVSSTLERYFPLVNTPHNDWQRLVSFITTQPAKDGEE